MGGHAWVTLATNDSYSLGALVLAHSLKQVGTQQQLAVLITPGVTGSMRSKLSEVFNVVIEVNLLDSKDETNLRLLKRPELGVTFTKLHCWRLTQFDKCVFLDADTLVLENCDELFDREEFSAAPDIGWPDCFNSGVFVFRPSMETYEKLIQFALEKGSFDGGDQGLLNLYFSDWAHKDISKHLPFIYNMASTACYSYLPAFKQFGKSAKIIHFIGSSKPWLQYFDTESRKVHPAEGVQHLQEVLQLWWNIFCNLIHPNLSPEMTSHTDTVHGSQSSTYQSPSQSCPTPTASSPAEDYQKVWDPWEEYDSRQQNNQPHSQISHENHIPSQISDNQHINIEIVQTHHPTEHHNIQGHPVVHHNIQSHPVIHHNIQSRPVVHHNIQSHPVEHHNIQSHPVEHHNIQSHPIEHHNIQNHPVEHHNIQSGSVEHHNFQRHAVQNHDIQSHSGHKEHIESLNTNACTEADNHHHDHPNPVYSQPQSPAIVPIPEHLFPTKPPPTNDPPAPKLPDECMATTTVSNEMTLQTDSKEDSKESNAGLAGAFAKLTLGAPRTAEQQALDDHLRRQGWEVGNIDYLGRDSFANIWNKICQTLSSAPEEPSATKEPSPPAVESKPVVDLPVEVKSDEQSMGVASSDIQPIKQVLEAEPVQTKGVEQVTPLPLAETPQPEACSRITVSKQIEQAEAIKLKDTVESKTEAEATDTPAPVVELAKVTETAPAQSQPVETLTSDISVPTEHTPTSEPQPATPVLPVAPVPEPSQPPPEQPSPPTLDTLPATKGSAPDIPVAPVLESPKLPPQLSTPTLDSQTATESPTSATPVATEPSQPSSEPVDSTVPVSAIPQTTYSVTSPDPTLEKPQPSVQTSETPVPPPTKAVCPMRKPVKNVDVPVIPVTATSETTGQPAAPKVQTLQAQVTSHSPPASPESPQIEKGKVAKEALKGETIVPATGQPASAPKVPIAQTQPAQVTGPSPPASPESPQPEQGKVAKGALKVETAVPATRQPAAPKVPIAHAQKPHAQVTGPSPPASPDSPQPEQEKVANEALKVETTVPATPPPVTQQTSSGPTPPPRKSSGGTKKATKPKK